MRFRLSPQVAIAVGARRKKPGEAMVGEPVELSLVERPQQGADGRLGDYERLLLNAVEGDATLFARQDGGKTAWAIVDAVLSDCGELHGYEPSTCGPRKADALVRDIGGSNTP